MAANRWPLLLLAAALVLLALSFTNGSASAQEEGWVIRSFDVEMNVADDGNVAVIEDMVVDFGTLQRHGIYRDIPVEYAYDKDHNRKVPITKVSVDDGQGNRVAFSSRMKGGYQELKIGSAGVLVSGEQRYRINYTAERALNPFDDHDELYWNVTGNQWVVPIERASANVQFPAQGIQRVQCFQGPTGSTNPCTSLIAGVTAQFASLSAMPAFSGLTAVIAIDKGLVFVGPPKLVDARVSPVEAVGEFLGAKPLPISMAAGLLVLLLVGVARVWWVVGRDRWYGDNFYLSDTAPPAGEQEKPLFAHETIVVQYTPPEIGGKERRMRPAEIGVLLDERADTLDVSATIVDLAVRKFLLIKELPKDGVFGIFKHQDYELERLEQNEDDLLPYEKLLLKALFDKPAVKLSELKYTFHDDLQKVKNDLYEEAVKRNKFFPREPDDARSQFQMTGIAIGVTGIALMAVLGKVFGAGVIGIPVIGIGVLLAVIAPAMPRRTAHGWEVYRRCLGFRLYMVTAETDRQKFAEEENIFHEYLPYAIVYGCVDKWARAFEGLGVEQQPYYYVGSGRFMPLIFASNLSSFSNSIGGVMASTPGGSGMSGFGGGFSGFGGGGGFSGGGVGGGGGGSW
jgi:uncharacterized membrane protein YgcG